ncbi:EAL domain-containing protein [Aeromonas veronii]
MTNISISIDNIHNKNCPPSHFSSTGYYFKFERIVSPYGGEVGCEILLDFIKAREVIGGAVKKQYENAIANGFALEVLIKKLIDSKRAMHTPRLFINIERSYLCNENLLKKIAILDKRLHLNGVELVLEITERNQCGKCAHIDAGLQQLKDLGIALAADDFDIYNGDFRFNEVMSGVYDYIKIEAPTNKLDRKLFNNFIIKTLHLKKKIIIEKVEDSAVLNGLFTPFGIQGYAYGTSPVQL